PGVCRRSRHGAVGDRKVAIGIDPHRLEMCGRPLLVAELARHPHPRVDRGWRRRRADRARLLDIVRAVGHRTAAEMMALVLTREALAFRGTGDVDPLSR